MNDRLIWREWLKKIILWILNLAEALTISIIVHEAGHAIVAIACGAPITRFSLFSVDWGDGNFTISKLAILYINGAGLVLITSLPMFFIRPSLILGRFSACYLFSTWVQLYSWILEPFFLHEWQDAAYFIMFSEVDVNVVRCISVIVGLAFTAAAIWKCSLQICNEIKSWPSLFSPIR